MSAKYHRTEEGKKCISEMLDPAEIFHALPTDVKDMVSFGSVTVVRRKNLQHD